VPTGSYSVISYSVAQPTHEISIRMPIRAQLLSIVVAILAKFFSAWRAMKVDPIAALGIDNGLPTSAHIWSWAIEKSG